MTTAELQTPIGDSIPEPTRDMFPHATDEQWEHVMSSRAKIRAYFEARGRGPRCCEFEAVIGPEEFETLRALIRIGDVSMPCCNETCPTFGEDIRAAKSVESARRLLAEREGAQPTE